MQNATRARVTVGKTPNRAGATPHFRLPAAQKVLGVAPASSILRRQESLPRSTRSLAFFVGRLEADTVTGALPTCVTVAVTNAVTSKASKTTDDTKVTNGIWTWGKHRRRVQPNKFACAH